VTSKYLSELIELDNFINVFFICISSFYHFHFKLKVIHGQKLLTFHLTFGKIFRFDKNISYIENVETHGVTFLIKVFFVSAITIFPHTLSI